MLNNSFPKPLNARPELESQLSQVRANQRQQSLASLQRRPDVTLGLNWIATSNSGISPVANGDDALVLGIGFNLPIYQHRIRSAELEAETSSLSSMAKLNSLEDQIAEEVFDTVTSLDSTGATLSLFQEDILPKSERTLTLSIDEFANGTVGYRELIDNWRSLLKYRMTVVSLRSNRMQLLATLGRQIGRLTPLEETTESSEILRPQFELENPNRKPGDTDANAAEVEESSDNNEPEQPSEPTVDR